MSLDYFIAPYGKADTWTSKLLNFSFNMIKSCWSWDPNYPLVAANGFGSSFLIFWIKK